MNLLKVCAAVVGVAVLSYIFCRNRKTSSNDKSLYDRLGGIYPIAAVVNHFSDALIDNPIAGKNSKNRYLRDWYANKMLSRLPGLKFMRTLWLASLSGGPFTYTATVPGKCPFSLENAHSNLQISSEEFDATAQELYKSLTYFKVPARERDEVMSAFKAHKGEINMGYDISHHTKIPNIIC